MAVQLRRRRFTVDEYHRMAAAGILGEDDRVELIEGEIIEMSPIGSRHAACVDRLAQIFLQAARGRAIVRVQSPVDLGQRSEPQPDLALLRPQEDFYAGGHPGPADILLVVEVAETTAEHDHQVKMPVYARAGIGEVWLVDLGAGSAEVHRRPAASGYGETQRFGRGRSLRPGCFADVSFDTDRILG